MKQLQSIIITIITAWIFLLVFTLSSFAENGLDGFSLEELGALQLSNTPSEIATTTAAKIAQTTAGSPSLVRIITAEDIKKHGYKTLGDILNGFPGLYTTSDGLSTFLGVRGLGRPSDYNTRVLILIDGIRVNDNLFDSALVGREFPLDIDLIQQVEYAPGPGSAVYGKNAFFGVINITTRSGNGLEASAGGGSYNTGKLRLTYGKRLKNGADVLFSATGFRNSDVSPSLYPEYSHHDSDDDKNINLFGRFSYQGFHADVIYGVRRTRFQYAPPELGNRYNVYDDDRMFLSTGYQTRLGRDWFIEVQGSLGDASYIETSPYIWRQDGNEYEDESRYKGTWLDTELRLINTSIKDHRILVGFEGHVDFEMEGQSVTRGENYFDKWFHQEDKYYNRAVFIQDEISFTNSLTLLLGGRYDYTEFENEFNPRCGIIWRPLENTILKLLYGSSFRSPNFYEISSNQDYAKFDQDLLKIPGNEKIKTYEAVVEHFPNKTIKLTGALYYYNIEGILELNENKLAINGDDIRAYGLELSAEKKFNNGIRINANYCTQKTEDKSVSRLTNSPEHQFKLRSILPLWSDKANLGADFQYISKRRLENGGTIDDYYLGNLTITYDVTDNIDFSASIYNITDSSFNTLYQGVKGRSRSFYFQLNTRL